MRQNYCNNKQIKYKFFTIKFEPAFVFTIFYDIIIWCEGGFALYLTGLFLVAALTMGGVLTHPSVAAPTVKRLDGATNNNVTLTKSSSASKRAPSLRISGSVSEPASKTTTSTKTANTTPKNPSSGESVRLPGLHGNLVKGIGSKLSSNYSQQSGGAVTSDLMQRVINLEEEVATKQKTLESGNGIDIDSNTISLSEEILVLPEKLEEINQELDNLNEKISTTNLSENYYTIDQTQDYVQQIVNNAPNSEMVYDSGTKEYKSVTIINDFDEVDFMNKVN